jgi:hypothetical protein
MAIERANVKIVVAVEYVSMGCRNIIANNARGAVFASTVSTSSYARSVEMVFVSMDARGPFAKSAEEAQFVRTTSSATTANSVVGLAFVNMAGKGEVARLVIRQDIFEVWSREEFERL